MSGTTSTRPVPQPRGGRAQPAVPAGQGATLGLLSATALVMGTIVGVGVFTMPAVLASAGTSSLVVLAVVAVPRAGVEVGSARGLGRSVFRACGAQCPA